VKRHEIDVISLVSGLLFAGLGAVFALHALDVFSIDVRDPGDWFKLLLIMVLLAGTSPVAAAATARAVARGGEKPETGS